MRIAYVSPYDWAVPGGVNRHIEVLADLMTALGHEVTIIAPASAPVTTPNVQVVAGTVSLPASGSQVRIAIDPRIKGRLDNIFADNQFDIVHLHEPFMPVIPLMALRASRRYTPGASNVATFHATREDGSPLYQVGKYFLTRSFDALDGRIAVSPTAQKYIQRYFNGSTRIIPNGIDIDHWDDANLDPISSLLKDKKVNILYVGRAEKRKGLGVLLEAFEKICTQRDDLRLIVVGPDSSNRRRYQEDMSSLVAGNTTWVTNPTYTELPRYHRSCDIFVSPATGNESQGYVLMEAMAAGLPVIASDISGYSHVVRHGKEGLLVSPNDSADLGRAIIQMADDASLRKSLANCGEERVKAYSWPTISVELIDFYRELIRAK